MPATDLGHERPQAIRHHDDDLQRVPDVPHILCKLVDTPLSPFSELDGAMRSVLALFDHNAPQHENSKLRRRRIAEKAWQMKQTGDVKGKNPEKTWTLCCAPAKENGRAKDKEDMATVWKEMKERS